MDVVVFALWAVAAIGAVAVAVWWFERTLRRRRRRGKKKRWRH